MPGGQKFKTPVLDENLKQTFCLHDIFAFFRVCPLRSLRNDQLVEGIPLRRGYRDIDACAVQHDCLRRLVDEIVEKAQWVSIGRERRQGGRSKACPVSNRPRAAIVMPGSGLPTEVPPYF